MSLLMQSNSTLKIKNRLADKVSGAALAIDFRDGYAKKNGMTDLTIDDAIAIEQPNIMASTKLNNTYTPVAANKPVISTYKSSVKKGLIVETPAYHFVLQSNNPVSKTQAINHFSYELLTLMIKGTGKVRLYIDDLGGYIGEATQDKPLHYSQTTDKGQALVARLEVIGQVSYYQIVSSPTFEERTAKVSTTTDWLLVAPTKVKIKTSLVQELLGAEKTGCLVLKVHKPKQIQLDSRVSKWGGKLATPRVSTIAQITDNAGKGIYFAHYSNNDNVGHKLRTMDSTNQEKELSIKPYFSDVETVIVAINFSKNKASAYINGEPVVNGGLPSAAIDFATVGLQDIYLISGDDLWSKTSSSMLEQVALYNRNLSIVEMAAITAI